MFAGFTASIVWLLFGSILYLNKGVKNRYRIMRSLPGVKKWIGTSGFYLFHYIILLITSLFAAVIFSFIKPGLPESIIWQALIFGTGICVFQTIPRVLETSLRTTYPSGLLMIEFLNYTMSGYAVALTLAFLI